MSRFVFTTRWVPGNRNIEADALSRAPIKHGTAEDELAEGSQAFTARIAIMGINTEDVTLERVKLAASSDPVLSALRTTILEGFPNEKCNLPLALRPYWNVRHGLAIDEEDDMIVLGASAVIPRSMVKEMLQILVSMHQGASKIRQRARLSLYWPHMDVDIANAATTCEECTSLLPSLPAEPLKPYEPATRLFECLHTELGEVDGHHFLVIVDQFSGWPSVTLFPEKNTTAHRLINTFRSFFLETGGAPVKLYSDNSPFQATELQSFLRNWGVAWGSFSLHYHQSNGRAEAGIKSMKKLVIGSSTGGRPDPDKLAKAILIFRNAPRYGAASPAQLVFNWPIRDSLQAHRRSFAPEWQKAADVLEERMHRALAINTSRYNRSTQPLATLQPGDQVLLQNPTTKRWNTPGIVVETGNHRDLIVRTPSGRLFRQNRRLLRQRVVIMPAVNSQATPAATPPAAISQTPPAAIPQTPPAAIPQTPPAAVGPIRTPTFEPVVPRQSTRKRQTTRRYPESCWTK